MDAREEPDLHTTKPPRNGAFPRLGRSRHSPGILGLGVILALAACGPTLAPGEGVSTSTMSDTGSSTHATTGGSSGTSAAPTQTDGSTSGSGEPDLGGTSMSDTTGCPEFDKDNIDNACNNFTQGGCPPCMKCAPYNLDGDQYWDEVGCVPSGDAGLGEPCTIGMDGVDSCKAGFLCWTSTISPGVGYCVEHCQGNVDGAYCDPRSGTTCLFIGFSFAVCLHTCDPLLQDCEFDGDLCNNANNTWVCLPDASNGEYPAGTPCPQYVCNPGHVCVHTGSYPAPGCVDSPRCCAPLCDLNAPSCPPDVPDGVECAPYYYGGPGYEHVGACWSPD